MSSRFVLTLLVLLAASQPSLAQTTWQTDIFGNRTCTTPNPNLSAGARIGIASGIAVLGLFAIFAVVNWMRGRRVPLPPQDAESFSQEPVKQLRSGPYVPAVLEANGSYMNLDGGYPAGQVGGYDNGGLEAPPYEAGPTQYPPKAYKGSNEGTQPLLGKETA